MHRSRRWRERCVPEARTPRGGGAGDMPPRKICKIGLSKMQFPAFPGPELGNRKGLLRRSKMFTRKEVFDWFGNYNYQFAVVRFLVDFKTDSNRKECTNLISLVEAESCSLEIVFIRSKGWVTITVGVRIITTDLKSQSSHCTATYNYLFFSFVCIT